MKATRFIMMFVAAAALLFSSCSKDEDDTDNATAASGSKELANTEWQLDNPDDAVYYHQHVIYNLTFGSTNQITYTVNVAEAETKMAGTYDYKNGSGTAYVKYVSRPDGMPEDTNEYRFTFTVSGTTLTLRVSGRDIALSEVR